MKECRKCHAIKDDSMFYNNKRSSDGLNLYCKECCRNYNINIRPRTHKKRPDWDGILTYDNGVIVSKVCHICGIGKPISEFSSDTWSTDGVKPGCRACYNIRRRLKYLEDQNLRDRTLLRAKKYKDDHYCQEKINRKKYRDEHRDRHNIVCMRRYLRKKGIPGTYELEQWYALKGMCGSICVKCGVDEIDAKLEADHIIPITIYGSSNYIKNIQPLCKSCNTSKRNNECIDYRPECVRKFLGVLSNN